MTKPITPNSSINLPPLSFSEQENIKTPATHSTHSVQKLIENHPVLASLLFASLVGGIMVLPLISSLVALQWAIVGCSTAVSLLSLVLIIKSDMQNNPSTDTESSVRNA